MRPNVVSKIQASQAGQMRQAGQMGYAGRARRASHACGWSVVGGQSHGKHAASVQRMRFDMRPWLSRRAAASATAVLLSALLVCPNAAFAAEWVNVGGTQYDNKYTAEDNTWSWDGADDMTLNGYNGGAISAKGDLNVGLVEGTTNVVENDGSTNGGEGALTVDQGDLTISGGGTLTAIAETDVIAATGDGVSGGDVTIDGATVNVVATGKVEEAGGDSYINDAQGIVANGGDVTIQNDASVYVKAGYDWDGTGPWPTESGAASAVGISASNCARSDSGDWGYTQSDHSYNKGGKISVDASSVSVEASGQYYASGLETATIGTSSTISIENDSSVFVAAVRSAVDSAGAAFGIAARGYEGGVGSVMLNDSFVGASAKGNTGTFDEGTEMGPIGICAWSQSDAASSTIGITNSAVIARGSLTAIESVNSSSNGQGAAGSISISDAKAYVFGGSGLVPGFVRDYESWTTANRPLSADAFANGYTEVLKGQVIGKAGTGVVDKLIDSDASSSSVDIFQGADPVPSPDPEPNPNPSPAPNPGTGSGSAPASGDASSGASGFQIQGTQVSRVQPAVSQASASVNPAGAKTVQASSAVAAMPKTADSAAELGIMATIIAAFTAVTCVFAARKRKQ